MLWNPMGRKLTDGEFYTLNKDGRIVLRDLKKENETFSVTEYYGGKFDSYNFLYYENFNFYEWGSNGSDYERYGCQIDYGVKVLDFGANIGAFARYARMKGAREVHCFEPMTPTFECLQLNTAGDPNTHIYNIGVSDRTGTATFEIHTDFTHNGGGSMVGFASNSLDIHHSQTSVLLGIAEIFESKKWEDAEFLKIDIEGAEQIVLEAIPDKALRSLAYISGEFHSHSPEFDIWQQNFIQKCADFGFESFVHYHGNGQLRTINLWKK